MSIVEGLAYTALFFYLTYNFWFLIIKLDRYKKFPVLIFYILAYLVIFGRLENYACVIRHLRNLSANESVQKQETIAYAVGGYIWSGSAKIVMGLYQWAQMLELKHRLDRISKLVSGEKVDPDDKAIRNLYLFVTIIGLLIIALTIVNILFLYVDTDAHYGPAININNWANFVGFLLLNLLMVCSYTLLMRAIANHKLKAQLKKETKLISIVFLVFTISYILRTAWALFLVIKYHAKAFENIEFLYRFYVISGALPLGWDIVPIGLLLYYHFKNFAPPSEQPKV